MIGLLWSYLKLFEPASSLTINPQKSSVLGLYDAKRVEDSLSESSIFVLVWCLPNNVEDCLSALRSAWWFKDKRRVLGQMLQELSLKKSIDLFLDNLFFVGCTWCRFCDLVPFTILAWFSFPILHNFIYLMKSVSFYNKEKVILHKWI